MCREERFKVTFPGKINMFFWIWLIIFQLFDNFLSWLSTLLLKVCGGTILRTRIFWKKNHIWISCGVWEQYLWLFANFFCLICQEGIQGVRRHFQNCILRVRVFKGTLFRVFFRKKVLFTSSEIDGKFFCLLTFLRFLCENCVLRVSGEHFVDFFPKKCHFYKVWVWWQEILPRDFFSAGLSKLPSLYPE